MTVMPAEHGTVALSNIETLDQAMAVCEQLAQSRLVPRRLQNDPASILLIYLNGRELNLSFAQSLRVIYAPGEGQIALRVSLMLARLREAGHDYWWEFSEDGDACTFYIKRKDSERDYSATFSLADAKAAGLVKEAANGDLVAYSPNNQPMPWMTYRSDMLFARSATRSVNRTCPEVLLGFGVIEASDPQPGTELQPEPATGQKLQATDEPPAPPADVTTGQGATSQAAAEELAALDAQGRAHTPEQVSGGEGQAPESPETAEAATPGMIKKVRDLFTEIGWNPRSHRVQIIEACTAFCRREVTSAAQLTAPEAGELIAALTIVQRSSEPVVTLEENVTLWRTDWREDDPEDYAKVLPE